MTSLSNNPSATEHKYSILRKRLDQMGYHHPLGLESVYLVERLFGDLIHTTESLKHEKSRSLQPQDAAAFEEYIKSYKTENAKLIRENNQLHQQLLAKQEKTENNVKGLKRSLQKLECENADLRFLNTQYLQRIKYLEEESQAKSDKIMQLQEKNLQAVVQTPGGKKRNIAFRRQKMEIEEMLLPRYLLYSPKKIEQPTDVYNTDVMSIADRRISQLEEEAQCIKKKQQETDKVCEYQQKQLEMRDKEINRLTKLLEGGRPLDAIRVEVKNQETEKHIAHLEMQVEYLQQENQELQEKCEDIGEVKKSLAHSVSSRGSPSLEDYTKSPRRLPHDNTMAEKEDLMKKRKEKSEIDKLKEELNQVNSIRKDLKKESQDLKILLEDKNQEQQKLEEVIHKLQEEIQTLSIRVNELQKNEKELVLEIDRLNSLKPSPEKEPSSRPSSSILLLVDALESERDHFKEEALALAQRLQSLKAGNSFFSSEKQTEETSSSQQTHDKMIKLLEDERDYYRQLYQQQLEDSHSIGRQAPSGSPTTTEKGVSTVNNDTGEVLEERDKLQKMLTQHKEELEELKYTIKVLKQDKEKAVNLYKQAKQEALNLQDELVKSAKSPNQSLASEAVIRRLEEEKKQNWYKYQQAQEEMDRLKDKLQVLEEDHQIEKKTLQKEIDQFKSHIKELEKQNSEHESSISSYKALLTTMNVQITSLESKLSKTEEQANQQKTAAAQMRVLVEQAEQSLEMLHKKLATKDEESHHTGQQFKELQKEIDNLNSLIEEQKNEQTRLRSTVAALDREKDQIQSEADSKAEHLVEAHQTLNKKDKELKDTKKTILMMEQQTDKLQEQIRGKDREIRSLQRELDIREKKIKDTEQMQNSAVQENHRLQEDLATMTKEYQAISQDLQYAVDEQHRLKREVQEYVTEVARVEELLNIKEQQRMELLEQYNNLSIENTSLENQTQNLASQNSTSQLELMAKEAELNHSRQMIAVLEAEVEEHLSTQQNYEFQLSSLKSSLEGLEMEVQQSHYKAKKIQEELSAAHQLCSQLEATRNTLQQQLANAESEKNKLSEINDELTEEISSLKIQLANEKASVLNLEGLLVSNREREFNSHLNNQELSVKLKLLQERLQETEGNLELQSRETASFRTQAAELEMNVERLEHQLTNEKFERERANQELRLIRQQHQNYISELHGKNAQYDTVSSGFPSVSATPKFGLLAHLSTSKTPSSSASLNYPSTASTKTGFLHSSAIMSSVINSAQKDTDTNTPSQFYTERVRLRHVSGTSTGGNSTKPPATRATTFSPASTSGLSSQLTSSKESPVTENILPEPHKTASVNVTTNAPSYKRTSDSVGQNTIEHLQDEDDHKKL